MPPPKLTKNGVELAAILFRMLDKPERVSALRAAMDRVPPTDVALLFGSVWTNSESLFLEGDALGDLIHFIRAEGVGHVVMDRDELKVFRKAVASPTITLMRGCVEENQVGYSWTRSKSIAELFAKRSAHRGPPYIITAVFDTKDVLAYFSGRDEEEFVVEVTTPTALRAIQTATKTAMSYSAPRSQSLAAQVQAFGSASLFGAEHQKVVNEMRASMARSQGMTWERFASIFERDIVLLERFGCFESKAAALRADLAEMKAAFDSAVAA